jgi:prepilin-type N-terminal cleavage/methylation domain-containing protein
MTRRPTRRAFTLIETIAVMVIVATISAVLSTVLYAATDAYASAEEGRRAVDSSSLAIETISREIRRQPPPTSTSLPCSLISASASHLEFESGLIIEHQGSTLTLTRPDQETAILLDPVDSVEFRLFAEGPPGGAPLDPDAGDEPGTARVVEISIDAGMGTLTTRLFLRSSLASGS